MPAAYDGGSQGPGLVLSIDKRQLDMTVEVKVLAWYTYKNVRQLDMIVEVQILAWYTYKNVRDLDFHRHMQLAFVYAQ
jgi:hypothetical protein